MSHSPKKILIVDDNEVILQAFSNKLRSCGYEVFTAEDGSAAVNSVRTKKPDLILLDINFPPDVAHGGGVPWDGFLIIDWLRRIDEAKNVPIIIITSGDQARYKQRAKDAGVISFFQKPVQPEELLVHIRKALGESAPAKPSQSGRAG